jgi:hypothetical protein
MLLIMTSCDYGANYFDLITDRFYYLCDLKGVGKEVALILGNFSL